MTTNNSCNFSTTIASWTPTVIGISSAGTATYSFQQGTFYKIGGVVTATFLLAWSSGTGTGTLGIGNLPFTVNESSSNLNIGLVNLGSGTITLPIGGTVAFYNCLNSTTTASINSYGTAFASAVPYQASGQISGQLIYFTNS